MSVVLVLRTLKARAQRSSAARALQQGCLNSFGSRTGPDPHSTTYREGQAERFCPSIRLGLWSLEGPEVREAVG